MNSSKLNQFISKIVLERYSYNLALHILLADHFIREVEVTVQTLVSYLCSGIVQNGKVKIGSSYQNRQT